MGWHIVLGRAPQSPIENYGMGLAVRITYQCSVGLMVDLLCREWGVSPSRHDRAALIARFGKGRKTGIGRNIR
jgi:hypothetical protein